MPTRLLARASCAALFSVTACAGAGRGYPCGLDGGTCTSVGGPGGGDFISAPVTVWHDGNHNSATDVVLFEGNLYASFRSARSWSADAAAQVFVVRSGDAGQSWQRTAALSAAAQDLREPKLVVFNGILWLFGTAWDASDPSAHRTTLSIASSVDGQTFSKVTTVALGQQPGLSLWRPRLLGAQLFLSVWRADELFPGATPTALTLFATSDAKSFASAGVPAVGPGAGQGELLVRASGERWLTAPERAMGALPAQQTVCHAPKDQLAFSCWPVPGTVIEGPVLFEYGSVLYVAGHHDLGTGRARTAIWQVLESDQALSLVADVPGSFGDTGAPGVVALDADRALLTFHSTSAQDAQVKALGHEPTQVEAESLGLAADVLAVVLYLPAAAAGR